LLKQQGPGNDAGAEIGRQQIEIIAVA
jgi:hypothetical protein